jgi:hypothetical protein
MRPQFAHDGKAAQNVAVGFGDLDQGRLQNYFVAVKRES